MKIVFVNNNLFGLTQFRIDVINHFIDKGYEVVAIVPSTAKETIDLDRIRVRFIPLNRASTNPFHDIKLLIHLMKIFRQERPDYGFFFTIKPNIYGTFAAKLCGFPSSMMMAGLGYTFTNNRLSSRIARFLYRVALKYTDKLLLLNEDNLKTVLRLKICNKGKIILLKGGEGVNLVKYPYYDNSSRVIRFLFIGRLIKEKGIYDFIEAAKEVKGLYSFADFQIAGIIDKEYPDSLKEHELIALEETGIIRYLGNIDMTEKLKEPGIVITIPSYYSEGLNRSLMEGCATGKPIITTEQPGCKETVIDGINGYIVPAQCPSKLAEAMIRYINLTEEEKMKMSKESRRLAESCFDVNMVIDVYNSIIHN